MSTDTNKQTARKFFESVDNGDANASQALLTPDFVARVAGNEHAMNAQEFLAMGRAFTTSFANSRHIIESQVAEGDCVETRLVWTGVHVGDFNGIPASQKPVKIEAVRRAPRHAYLRQAQRRDPSGPCDLRVGERTDSFDGAEDVATTLTAPRRDCQRGAAVPARRR